MKGPSKLRPIQGGKMWNQGVEMGDGDGKPGAFEIAAMRGVMPDRYAPGVDWSDVARSDVEREIENIFGGKGCDGCASSAGCDRCTPPADPELEAERARLLGKMVRICGGEDSYDVVSVERGGAEFRVVVRHAEGRTFAVTTSTRDHYGIEPIPDEPAKPEACTFGELEVGEEFERADGESLIGDDGELLRWRKTGPDTAKGVNNGWSGIIRSPIEELFRRIPAPGGAK